MDGDIRALGAADVEACLALATARGWPAEPDRWRLFLAIGAGRGVDHPDGDGLASAGIALPAPPAATIGLVLVAPELERRGLGRTLVTRLLEEVNGRTVLLYATPEGRPLYERLGFRQAGDLVVHAASRTWITTAPSEDVRPYRSSDLDAVLAADRAAFGGDRGPLLRHLLRTGTAVVTPTGFALAWHNADQIMLGPIVAGTHDEAASLLTGLVERIPAGTLRLDVPAEHAGLCAAARSLGFAAVRRDPLMVHGSADVPGDRERLFAVASQATG